MGNSRTITETDRAVLDALARAGLDYVRLPDEANLVQRAISPDETPARRLAAMARRGSLFRISRGVYVVARSGARTVRQAADPHLLLAAMLDGRKPYYLGFLNTLAEHGLTDEPVTGLRAAVSEPMQRTMDLAGTMLQTTTVRSDCQLESQAGNAVDPGWPGVERVRIRGRMFYSRASPERTLVDALDRPKLCGTSELWVRAWARALRGDRGSLDLSLLLHLARNRSHAVAVRCALLLRELGRPREGELLTSQPVTGKVLFDASTTEPTGEPWRRDRATGLVMNVPIDTVRGWLEYDK